MKSENQISFCGLTLEAVLVSAGNFVMGSEKGLELERPAHCVEIKSPFWIGKYLVTQAQWEAVMGKNPSEFKGGANLPVENVSWDDCQIFCVELSNATGKHIRLP